MKLRSYLPLVLVGVVAIAIAQQSSSTSSSQTGPGQATSSARGSASSSSSQGGGFSGSNNSASSRLAKPTHAIMWVAGEKWVEDKSTADQPMAFEQNQYLANLARQGKIVMSGPWRDEPGGMTLVIVRTDEEAQAIVDDAPMVKIGVLSAEIKAWNVTLVGAMAAAPK